MRVNDLRPPGPAAGTAALLQRLRDGKPRTRAELVAETGLARSTVAERIETLLASGFLRHADKAESTGGRPPTMFAFNPAARVVLAADIGATHMLLAVTDLDGNVLAEESHEQDIAEGPEKVLDEVCAGGKRLLAQVNRHPDDLLGVGVGLPGPVEHSTGRPNSPPIMPGWDNFDVMGYVHQRLHARTYVDNDVNIMALGEHRTQWPDASDLLFVKVATGIGSGLISDGRLHRGAQGAAGDMGHVQLPHGADVPCRCGNVGCLEAIASGAAVAAKLTAAGTPASSSSDVVALARSGSVPALTMLRQAGRDIGEVLATAVSLFNPSVIVIGGSLSLAGEHLIAGVREVVYRRSLPLATQHLRIVTSRAGERAGVLGAAFMVIGQAFEPALLDELVSA
ncbi:ROK family protein [Thermocrispum municipale]|jgi:glucokinase|uniref:ROK family protein n=1 Tax=Thermocrispum municipale TaxID=37926 RepID=UPI00041D60CD|nr:ROK family transcriptional regulator [Thermocrispum municipale]